MILSRHEVKRILIIVFIAMGGLMGIDIHLPSMPAIMHFMHTDKTHMQMSVALYLLGMLLGVLFYGPISDRVGRRPVVIFGLILTAIASYAAVFSTAITGFLVLRLIQGLGAGACGGLARTMSADVMTTPEKRNLGAYFSIIVSASPLIAPVIGGYLQAHFEWQANFFFLGSYLTIMLIIYSGFCEETNTNIQRDQPVLRLAFDNYRYLIQHKRFVLITLVSAFARTTTTAYATVSAFLFILVFHLSAVAYGWLTMAASLGLIVAKLLKPVLTRRLGEMSVIILAITMIAISAAMLLLQYGTGATTAAWVVAAIFIAITAQPLIISNTMYMALAPFHDRRGAAGALYAAIIGAVTVVVSALLGLATMNDVLLLGLCFAVVAVLSSGCLYVYVQARQVR